MIPADEARKVACEYNCPRENCLELLTKVEDTIMEASKIGEYSCRFQIQASQDLTRLTNHLIAHGYNYYTADATDTYTVIQITW